MSADPLERLTRLLARLPGLGEKSGARLAHHLWRAPERFVDDLVQALREVKEKVRPCSVCGRPTDRETCSICADEERDPGLILVVENAQDLRAIEATGAFRGRYHVLGGTLSPLLGRGPESLSAAKLFERAADPAVQEIILATNPSAEGDATAAWLEEKLAALGRKLKLTRLARGVPVGAELRYLDPLSLMQSLQGRK